MKYRLDFVTNSSSSSFVCDVCGSIESGWDMGLSEAEMYECTEGHTFCESHINFTEEQEIYAILNYLEKEFDFDYYLKDEDFKDTYGNTKEEIIKNLKESEDIREEFEENYMEFRYNFPSELCPICNHTTVLDSQIIEFASKRLGVTKDELENMTREFLNNK